MNAKSFINIGLFSVGIPAMNIGSAFAWKCSRGVEHKKDEACFCCWQWERACDNPMCTSDYHSGYEVCPQSVFGFRSEGIKYVILPYRVPERKIAELWYEYGCSNVRRDEQYAEYCPKIEPDQNVEVQRLESQVQKLKEKLRKSSPRYLEKQEKIKKLNAYMQEKRKEFEAKRNKMINDKEMERIKQEEEGAKRRVREKFLKRKEALQLEKDKKDGK